MAGKIACVALLLGFFAVSCSAPGGTSEALWGLALNDDTIYASGYTDDQFNSIRVGMSEGEVVHRLGAPLDTYYPTVADPTWDKGMRWSKSAHDSNYKVRVLLFRRGHVSEKFAEFYVD